MGYDLAMIRPSKTAAATLALAACCLAACGAPKAAPAPAVTGISVASAADMSRQFCDDLDTRSYKESISRMAVRTAEAKLSRADQDAVLEHAAVICPRTIARAAP
jgi:hypothetical protein